MSDLAPFVAATIRDRVVADLMAENERLRNQLRAKSRASQRIRVTSEEQHTLYSAGSFEDGRFHRGNANLWVVPLETMTEAPLKDLKSSEFHYGDAPFVSQKWNTLANNDDTHLSLNTMHPRTDDGLPVEFAFNEASVRLTILVKNWPSNNVLQEFMETPSTQQKVALRILGERHADMVVEFVEVTLACGQMIFSDVFDEMSLGAADAERLQGQRQSEKVYVAALRIFSAEYEDYDATNSDLIQYIQVVGDVLVEQGQTVVESEQFREAVLNTFPGRHEEAS